MSSNLWIFPLGGTLMQSVLVALSALQAVDTSSQQPAVE